jgi:hypothetical protein
MAGERSIPTANLHHIFAALVAFLWNDASQSPYPGRQTFLIAAQAASIQPDDVCHHETLFESILMRSPRLE